VLFTSNFTRSMLTYVTAENLVLNQVYTIVGILKSDIEITLAK